MNSLVNTRSSPARYHTLRTPIYPASLLQVLKMTAARRALLIASPFGALRGPLNDVGNVAFVLSQQGFDIPMLCGDVATRAGILGEWERIVKVSRPNDHLLFRPQRDRRRGY